MDALVNELMKELNCDTVFTIPVLGGIPVKESVVVTWIIMAVILVLCIALTRNLSVENPSRGQIILETIVSGGHNFFKDTLGEHGAEYIPYLMTVTLYIGIANLIGLLGFKPPTKDMNVTAALAFMSIVLIEVAGIRQKGAKGWVKSFAEPIPIILPIIVKTGTGLELGCATVFLADVVDYGEYVLEVRNEGVIFSLQTLIVKFTAAFTALAIGFVLELTGYVPNTVQTLATQNSIRILMCIVPALGIILAYVVFKTKYKLNDEFMKKVISKITGSSTSSEQE